MFYKMAFIDLDGTLLSWFDKISFANLKSLKKYKYLGGEIVLCTGRWPISAYKINSIIENYTGQKNKYLVCLNGSLIYDLDSKKIISKEFIDSTICEKILEIRKQFHVRSFIYSETGIQNKLIHTFRTPFKKIVGFFNSGVKIENFSTSNNEDLIIYKILFFSLSTRKISKAYNELQANFSNKIQISKTSNHSIELTALNISKGYGLKMISKLSNIPNEEIAAFGDSGNDISMFQQSGISFAIKSNNKNLLNISKHSVKEKNGVSIAIETILLNHISNFKNSNKNLILDISYYDFSILNDNVNLYKNIFNFFLLNGNFILISSEPAIDVVNSLDNFLKSTNLIFCNNSCALYSIQEKKYLYSKFFSETRMSMILDIINKEIEYNRQAVFVFYVTKHTHYIVANTFTDYELFLQNNNLNREFYEFIKLDELLSKYVTSICQVRIFNYKYKIDIESELTIRVHDNFIDINPSKGFSHTEKGIMNIIKFDGKTKVISNEYISQIDNKKNKEKSLLKEIDKEIETNILV